MLATGGEFRRIGGMKVMLLLGWFLIGFFVGLLAGMAFMKWCIKSSGDPVGFMELWDDVDNKLKKRDKQGE